jgi:methionyl-tRNA synthetase
LSQQTFFLTTAIDYANGAPHHGHAFEKIGADAIARYRRSRGDRVHFLMGMDEHGQKVAQSAAAHGVSPQEWTDAIASQFGRTWERLRISHDQFIRTTDPAHQAGVRALIERIFERNPDDFYEQSYQGWYCVGCELFKRDTEIVDGRCVTHPRLELQWSEETNWFFRLSRYQGFLEDLFRRRPDFLLPDSRRNEILSLLASGLEDISVTRSNLSWAIPFPRPTSGGEVQGTWVWFDALPNYLTATGYPQQGYDRLWPAQLHVVGKDIIRLHTVVWPAMLHSAELPLPERVWGHGFVQLGGERFSKSSGVQMNLQEAIDRFGPDAFRYYLLREVPWDSDGNFSWERFEERYTAELANDLGNLANRTLSMVARYRGGVVPEGTSTRLDAWAADAVVAFRDRMDALRLHDAAAAALALVSEANSFVEEMAPWKLARDAGRADDLDATLASLVRTLGVIVVLLYPFMPGKMDELWSHLGSGSDLPLLDELERLNAAGWEVRTGAILFPRPETADTP